MTDGYGRKIDYLRISITDRCNLRCVYCMPECGVKKLAHDNILTYEEIIRIGCVMAGLGIRKVKITGGEPLVRKDVVGLVEALKVVKGIECVTLTTNGVLLERYADALYRAGVDGINVSLDTLDRDHYSEMTRGGNLEQVLRGIDAAAKLCIPLKVNCVPVEGLNAGDAANVAVLAKNRDIHVRFIEMMPIGLGCAFDGVENREIRACLEEQYGRLRPYAHSLGNGPAKYFRIPGFRGQVGFISAMGDCFCGGCNRIRLTADGYLKNCLHKDAGTNLIYALGSADNAQLRELIASAVAQKPERHGFDAGEGYGRRIMSQIGG